MEPINKTERSKAFGTFLLFFIITATLIIAAVFFSVQVPFSENRQLKEQIQKIEAERHTNEKFQAHLDSVVQLFDEYTKSPATDGNTSLIANSIDREISVMANMAPDTSLAIDPSIKQIFIKVSLCLSNYLIAKKEIKTDTKGETQLTSTLEDNKKLKTQNEKLSKDLKDCQKNINTQNQ